MKGKHMGREKQWHGGCEKRSEALGFHQQTQAWIDPVVAAEGNEHPLDAVLDGEDIRAVSVGIVTL